MELSKLPFSRFGSFFTISLYRDKHSKEIYIRDVRGGDNDPGKLFKIKLYRDNEEIKGYKTALTETCLTLSHNTSKVSFIYPDEDTLRINGAGLEVRLLYHLKRYDNIYQIKPGLWELASYSKEIKLLIKQIKGKVLIDAPWDTIGNTHITLAFNTDKSQEFDITLQSYKSVFTGAADVEPDFNKARQKTAAEYHNWYRSLPFAAGRFEKSRKTASYITWANFVKPEGKLKKYAMYMSKNWMTNIWSWDNCFSAVFLAKNHPDLAYGQFIFFKDHQTEQGAYPDFVNNDYASFSCLKPPIYGWCYDMMMQRNTVFTEKKKLKEVYRTVSGLTNFWLNHRMSTMGLPYYTHGNDSGWDNSTVFHSGIPVVAPDLTAYIIYQLDFLDRLSKILQINDKKDWKKKADELNDKLINNLWKKEGFKAYLPCEDKYAGEGDSLQLLLPILIHYRLPEHIKAKIIASLSDKKRFNAKYGLATEALNSPYYQENGYWRGPVWAPVMLLFIDSLNKSGNRSLSLQLAKNFCEAVNTGGMAENFDPLTGEGLVDPAFAWTSSVFMLLMEEYCPDF